MTTCNPLLRAVMPFLSGLSGAAALLASPAVALAAVAQSPLASQTLGRGYTHVFIAYAIAWLLVFGWIFSITRRLARVESELER